LNVYFCITFTMMKKVYYLSTCSTCKKIMNDLDLSDFIKQDIKYNPITRSQLESLYNINSSYEALFSKRSKKYFSLSLKYKNLKEDDFKELILQEYTFLKRPVFILDKNIFVGNSKENIRELRENLL